MSCFQRIGVLSGSSAQDGQVRTAEARPIRQMPVVLNTIQGGMMVGNVG